MGLLDVGGRHEARRMEFLYERRVTSEDEGTDWLYVDPVKKTSHRVEIDAVPDRAHRIRVQHLDRDMGGKAEWVPIARAKVPWALREDYEATLRMWGAAEKHCPPSSQGDVALMLLDTYLDPSVAEIYYTGVEGILVIPDVAELAQITGIDAETLSGHEDSFVDEVLYTPWPTTLLVLQALCRRDPRPALEMLAQRKADDDVFKQRVARDGDPWWVQEAREGNREAKKIRRWTEMEEESIRFLRWLVDAGTPSLAEDFLQLREMYLDFVNIVPDAVARIRLVPAKLSQDMAARLQELADRPLPHSSGLLGAEPREPA